ncbi:NHL domain-containing protein [Verrucomicrobiota bacterium sgz303538]
MLASTPRLPSIGACLFACILFTAHALADRVVLVAGGEKDATGIPAVESKLKEPFGVDFDQAGNMWIVEMVSGNRLLKVDRNGLLTHVAGQTTFGLSGDAGPALEAQFNGPHNLALLADGDVLIADTFNKKIRKVAAKSGTMAATPDFKTLDNQIRPASPFCISLDSTGARLYVADLHRVWLLDLKTGEAKIVAGNGKKGVPTDGAVATEAPLMDPRAVAPDHSGNVYILERDGHALRVVDKEGRIRTVVNASGKKGATGDDGPALQATMNGPKHLCVDKDDSVIIADAENNLIRRYQPKDGKIHRVAGTGVKGNAGVNGDPLKVQLARPHGVTIHPSTGELYITDSYNNRILKVVRD